jgi:uncharacterized protein (DUF433 family)
MIGESISRIEAMATLSVDIGTLITRTPGLHGGVPHIAGKGVTVRRIVFWSKERGLTPEEIADEVGHISLAEVHAALTYYYVNQAEIDHDIEQQALEAVTLERQYSQAR